MQTTSQYLAELKSMTEAELVQVGEDSMSTRLREQAVEARQRNGVLSPTNMDRFFRDSETMRYPTRLALEYGEIAEHQFAQPGMDFRDPTGKGRVLYLRPDLGSRPDLLVLAVAYMIPVLNYGERVSDDHCIQYGAALLDMHEDCFYDAVCSMADWCGAQERFAEELPATSDCGSPTCSCSR